MKWRYISGADVYKRKNHTIVVAHTPQFEEKFDLNNGEYTIIVPWGAHWFGLHKINTYLRATNQHK